MTVDIIRDIFTEFKPEIDKIIIVAGDADYVPAIREARKAGYYVKVAYWNHAAAEMKKAASEFQSLNGHLFDLTHK